MRFLENCKTYLRSDNHSILPSKHMMLERRNLVQIRSMLVQTKFWRCFNVMSPLGHPWEFWFDCVLRPIDSEVILRQHPHLLALAKDGKIGFNTFPTGKWTPGRCVAVHYTNAAPRQLREFWFSILHAYLTLRDQQKLRALSSPMNRVHYA